jgi:TRAP-type C4-dicarboxylate transport system substrate-binding protein
MNLKKPAAALVALSALCAGCTGTASDKSGGVSPRRVLVLASNDAEVSAPAVARFADRVQELSGGRVTVRIASDWGGGGSEARVIQDVAAGKADLGWSGTRAFDTVGVTAFEPLHLPFLVGSYAAEASVVKDAVARNMLAGLRPLGLTGLALAADELRMPAAAAKPLLTPSDFRGLRFGTIASRVQAQGLAALGAKPVAIGRARPPDTDGLGAVDTMWSSFLTNHQYGFMPFVTGNAALWPRTVAVFANTKRLDDLDATTRGWLERAAADAQTWSTQHAADLVPAQLAESCSAGLRVATVTPAQLQALRDAAQPAYAQLRRDPALATTLDRVQALVAAAGSDPEPTIPGSCAYKPGDETRTQAPEQVLTAPGREGTLPQGTYRHAVSVDDLVAHGDGREDAENNGGVYTWTLRAGRWRSVQEPELTNITHHPASPVCEGWYDVQGDTAWFTTTSLFPNGDDCAPPSWSARWTIKDRTLTWTSVSVADFAYVWAGHPWRRIA